jgi:isochorismate hydrolase
MVISGLMVLKERKFDRTPSCNVFHLENYFLQVQQNQHSMVDRILKEKARLKEIITVMNIDSRLWEKKKI